uniref:NADH-ubiquinone oxidoreductase chain 3 n=1 Tax=Monobothrioides sp. JB-2012 TaxID=1159341 RepID=H9YU47_9CEST|nr:NADH dehydrogenase subunit 3 [Monobothrioides sp. JB-2012]
MLTLLSVWGVVLIIFIGVGSGCSFVLSRQVDSGGVNWAGPYECGFMSGVVNFDSFGFSYFSLMVLFVIFDLEISLLLNMPEQGWLFDSFYYYLGSLFLLVGGFLSEVASGYVRWGY